MATRKDPDAKLRTLISEELPGATILGAQLKYKKGSHNSYYPHLLLDIVNKDGERLTFEVRANHNNARAYGWRTCLKAKVLGRDKASEKKLAAQRKARALLSDEERALLGLE